MNISLVTILSWVKNEFYEFADIKDWVQKPTKNFHSIFLCKFAVCMGGISNHSLGLKFSIQSKSEVKSQNVKPFFRNDNQK